MKKFWIKLNGHSMSPLLLDRDTILIESIKESEINKAEILLFIDQESKELTIHRLLDFPFVTKGDFSLSCESNPPESCLGRAIGFKRGNVYRELSHRNSFYTRTYLILSKMRMQGFVLRKFARIGLILLTKVLELCSDKTKLSHSEELKLADP